MSHSIFLMSCLALFGPSVAWASQVVPAAEIQAAAHERILQRTPSSMGRLDAVPIGRVEDATVADGAYTVHAGEIAGRWPRSRIGIPVQVSLDGRKVRSTTVWYAVRLMRDGWVYSADYEKGRDGGATAMRAGAIDLARIKDVPMAQGQDLSRSRLRRFVRAGEAVESADFEPLPDVVSRQPVQVEVLRGAVRLLTKGEAMGDGRIGDEVDVTLPVSGQTVHSRIISQQVVRVEN